MRRVALAVAMLLAAPAVRADPQQPAFMPAPPRPPTSGDEDEIRRLKHEATAFGTTGIVLAAAGIAVNVVALDVPQGERAVRQSDGTVVTQHVLADANWAELAGGIALLGTGAALIAIAVVKANRAKKLQSSW